MLAGDKGEEHGPGNNQRQKRNKKNSGDNAVAERLSEDGITVH